MPSRSWRWATRPRRHRTAPWRRAGSSTSPGHSTAPKRYLPGATYKLRWPESDHAIYVTINDTVRDGRRCPFEVFINSKNMDHYAWTLGLTRMISAVFRRGGDVTFVVEELKAVFDPRGGCLDERPLRPLAAGRPGRRPGGHMKRIGFIPADEAELALAGGGEGGPSAEILPGPGAGPRSCPRCGQPSLIPQEGCDMCTSCGYSKCA